MRALRTTFASHRPQRPAGAPLSRQTVWLFDLDNTLHDASKSIFKAINGAMTNAVATTLNIDIDAANAVRRAYWKRYGATVIGMARHHNVSAHTFLELSHDFDIAPLVHSENGLARKLQQLPGRKILLTNAPLKYAREVMKTLGILPQFEGLWAIDHMDIQGRMRPKPSLALMKQIGARLRVPTSQIVLVEDTLRNLKSARQVGMRTVHVFHPGTPFSSLQNGRPSYVDIRVNSIGKLLVGRQRW
ncbi:pyrimidine 5'-nucleotidase [Alcaligenaceae bacterium]|nr:pyrimidine 5'-nucleotidase [Alcaligenaceae bacterium]